MNVALIAAAGIGKRMGSQGKQYAALLGEPVLAHTLRAFQDCPEVQEIIVVANARDLDRCQAVAKDHGIAKVREVVPGGEERQDSIYNGLMALPQGTQVVVVHDGARPLITPNIISSAFSKLDGWDGVVVGVPAKDTLKRVNGEQVVETLDRRDLWHVQTPQVFKAEMLARAYKKARNEGFYGTDDAVLMERLGFRIRMIFGSYGNIKITTPEDLVAAEAILKNRKYKNAEQ